MNVFGIGNLELLWIMLIALVLLGPGRLVDAARAAGKFWREAQHAVRAVTDAASVNLDAPPPKIVPREPLPSPGDAVARDDNADDGDDADGADEQDAKADADDGGEEAQPPSDGAARREAP